MEHNTKRFLTKKVFFCFTFFLAVVFEVIYKKTGFDFFHFFLHTILPWFFPSAVVSIFVEPLKKIFTSKNKNKTQSHSDLNKRISFESLLQNAELFLKETLNNAKNSSICCFFVVLLFSLSISSSAAHFRIIGNTLSILGTNKDLSASTQTVDSPEISKKEPTESEKLDDNENENIQIPISTEKSNSSGFLIDPERCFRLSEEEYSRLYFSSGAYAILDCSDDEAVAHTLSKFFSDLRAQNRKNSFDKEASKDLCNEVSYASELEKRLTSSEQLDNIIAIRINAWNQYPKHRLARLLASNQQRYALEYHKANGSFTTIEYYYAQSIFWLFQSLTFSEVDSYTEKSILNSIKMRYHDIEAIAPDGSINQQRANALYEAFKMLEKD